MADNDRSPRVTALAKSIVAECGLLQNVYLEALADGSMDLACFRRSQQQFYFAVLFFPRPMAALVAKIPEPRARIEILRNVVEEHGEFHEEAFHRNTFQRFLATIGSDVEALDTLALWPAVRAFNSVLISACVLDELEVGIGCMGIIEFAFADISARIGKAVVENGWVKEDDLVHYKLHAEIDNRHADEFFAVIEHLWDDPKRRYYIEQGLRLGAYIFNRLYTDLHAAATRG